MTTPSGARRATTGLHMMALGAALALAACGNGDDWQPSASAAELPPPAAPAPTRIRPSAAVAASSGTGDADASAGSAAGPGSSGREGPPPRPAAPSTTAPARRCSAPEGTSNAPTDIPELLALLNALPKPTTLECFLESLARPLEIYPTRSELSAQPASGARSPRTFIVYGDLVMSVVPDGELEALLEVGYRSAPGRSIKGELAFPLRGAVTARQLAERVRIGDATLCGGCHIAEERIDAPSFPDGAFESEVIVPHRAYDVQLGALAAEAAGCDATLEPARCRVLRAIFDHGEVRMTRLWADNTL